MEHYYSPGIFVHCNVIDAAVSPGIAIKDIIAMKSFGHKQQNALYISIRYLVKY